MSESQTKRSSRFILRQALANDLRGDDLRAIADDVDAIEQQILTTYFDFFKHLDSCSAFRKRYIAAILDEPEV